LRVGVGAFCENFLNNKLNINGLSNLTEQSEWVENKKENCKSLGKENDNIITDSNWLNISFIYISMLDVYICICIHIQIYETTLKSCCTSTIDTYI
jgi:hypothetical protein